MRLSIKFIGAGITATTGTSFALQLILVKAFKVNSFQLQGLERRNSCIGYFSPVPLDIAKQSELLEN